MLARLTALMLVLSLCSTALASTWVVTDAQLTRQSVKVKSLDAKHLKYQGGGGSTVDKKLSVDEMVSLRKAGRRTVALRADGWTMLLNGNDRVGGTPLGLDGESLKWDNKALGEFSTPLDQLVGVVRVGKKIAGIDAKRSKDAVVLSNGDRVEGILIDITAEKLTLQRSGGESAIPMNSIDALLLASTARALQSFDRHFRIALEDGTSVRAKAVSIKDDKLTTTLADGKKKELSLDTVVLVEQVNGPVAWLSEITPISAKQTPFVAKGTWQPRMNATVDGNPISVRGVAYDHGIGVRSKSVVTWKLAGGFKAFRTQYTVDDTSGHLPLANMTVRLKLDDKVVHEQKNVTAGTLYPVVAVALKDAKTITLEVDYGEGFDAQDKLNFIEPVLLRNKPADVE